MTPLAGREAPERTREQTALAGVVAALTWEHAREKIPGPAQRAPRTIIYPKERERVAQRVMVGKWHILPPELECSGQQIANLREGWRQNV